MKITVVLLGAKDSLGRQRIYLRTSEGQKRTHHRTPLIVSPQDFDKGRVLPSHPQADIYNKEIKRLLVEKEAEAHGLVNRKEKARVVDFRDYAIDLFRRLDREREPGTIRNYHGQMEKFLRFAPGISLQAITKKTLEAYKQHCYSLGNEGNSVWSSLKFLKMVIYRAIDEDELAGDPFKGFAFPKYSPPQKHYLTEEQIAKIDAYRKDAECPGEVRFAATWFLIGCYTGLRYSDMHGFNREKHIVRGRLVIYTKKTKEPVSLPLHEKVKGWLGEIDYRPLDISNGHYNTQLKILAASLKIRLKFTSHLARHTFAVLCADMGISQEVTAKLLGQANLATTAVYYKLSNKRIDSEYGKLS